MVGLAKKGGWIGFVKLFESLRTVFVESDWPQNQKIKFARQYTFNWLK